VRTAVLSLATLVLALFVADASAQTGNLRIKAKPGTAIVVNDTYLGEVSTRTGRLVVTGIPAGVHAVRALVPGKPGVVRRVTVVAGRTSELSFLAPARPTGDRTVAYPGSSTPRRPAGYGGRTGFHPPDTRPRPGKYGPYRTRRAQSKFSMALSLPCIISPVDDATFAGPGLTATLRLSKMFSLSASLFTCFEDGELDDGTWISLSAGPLFELGGGSFKWIFRPGLAISHLEYDGYYSYYDSFGFGLNVITGPELSLGDRFSIGAFLGLEALLKAYQGDHYVYATEPGSSVYWEEESSRFNIFFGLQLKLDF